jgi:predicted nucleic acid-binding protein
MLYRQVRGGELTKAEAQSRLDRVRALNIRLLGDRVLQAAAWKVADQLGWPDTLTAEYLALTQLQADAFVTCDAGLAASAGAVVAVAPLSALYG